MATAFTNAQVTTANKNTGPRGLDPTKKPGQGTLMLQIQRVNFDQIATDTSTALAANDTFQVYQCKAGEVILIAGVKGVKVTTGACTIDLGFTGGTVDYFMDGFTASSLTGHTLSAGGDGMFCTTATTETVDLKTLTTSGAGGIVDVWFLIARI